ncbi:MAG: UDP-3-O-(3-hydroxymyristoyl)glucosamine N-acyltransferase [Verrucomicrobia bacterium]|nr:MAG: UDP-3-O-(3-hydroxymyristoyl)glucosamine N-acyltransferase [Verrucomicrobiota bacterium]
MAAHITLSQLAEWIGGDIVRGEPERAFSGIAALGDAQPGDVSFFGNEKYRAQLQVTAAGVVIVPPGAHEAPAHVALLEVANPSLAFSIVVNHFAARARKFEPGIHPSAYVDPTAELAANSVRVQAGAVVLAGAKIAAGCDIGPNAVIGEDVVMGNDCQVMANVSVRERCILGKRVILQPGAVIGSDGYGYEFSDGRHVKIDQVGIVEIADDVEIGANSTIDRARFGKTFIGAGTKIDNLVQIGHNVTLGKHCLIVSQTGISGSSTLEDYVTCAGQSGIGGHVTVGCKSVITARTAVTTDLKGGEVYSGKPALLMREDLKVQALVRRLPKLLERIRALEKKSPSSDG